MLKSYYREVTTSYGWKRSNLIGKTGISLLLALGTLLHPIGLLLEKIIDHKEKKEWQRSPAGKRSAYAALIEDFSANEVHLLLLDQLELQAPGLPTEERKLIIKQRMSRLNAELRTRLKQLETKKSI